MGRGCAMGGGCVMRGHRLCDMVGLLCDMETDCVLWEGLCDVATAPP